MVLVLQVKEASRRLENKLSSLQVEVKFVEKIHQLMSSTQVQMKAEVLVRLYIPLRHFSSARSSNVSVLVRAGRQQQPAAVSHQQPSARAEDDDGGRTGGDVHTVLLQQY